MKVFAEEMAKFIEESNYSSDIMVHRLRTHGRFPSYGLGIPVLEKYKDMLECERAVYLLDQLDKMNEAGVITDLDTDKCSFKVIRRGKAIDFSYHEETMVHPIVREDLGIDISTEVKTLLFDTESEFSSFGFDTMANKYTNSIHTLLEERLNPRGFVSIEEEGDYSRTDTHLNITFEDENQDQFVSVVYNRDTNEYRADLNTKDVKGILTFSGDKLVEFIETTFPFVEGIEALFETRPRNLNLIYMGLG